jgi:hypothetical protein
VLRLKSFLEKETIPAVVKKKINNRSIQSDANLFWGDVLKKYYDTNH